MNEEKRKWLPLFLTNYLGVLNDNFLKTLACFICVHWVGKEFESLVVTTASGALVVPYLLFSPLAGRWSKIYSKRRVVVWAKFAELFIMVLAGVGFLTRSVYVVLFSILVMGLQSALFSPAKYGLIRDIGGEEGVSYGSGAMEMFAFIGILSGTLLASFLSESLPIPWLCLLLLGIALLGWLSSFTIRARESEPERKGRDTLNPLRFSCDMFRRARTIPGLNRVVFGLAVFWLLGAMIQMILIVYCRNELAMSDFQTGVVMAMAAIGIGGGCFLAGVFSRREIRLRFVSFGGIATGGLFLAIYLLAPRGIVFAGLILLAALCSGFYKVPLDAWIQRYVKGRELGNMLAYSNMVTFLFMLFASLFFWLIDFFGETRFMFLFLGAVLWGATAWLYFGLDGVRRCKTKTGTDL